ncbi:AAA family ATPase [Intrasporangium chromatireducens]|uniref:AAA family ATPase n=1 Tax=Intrasporangium chromatireducens TaxID=1386088 RepID=UPI0004BB7D45|nr:AAA family ATPase [Intrasporangium chromatireducens]
MADTHRAAVVLCDRGTVDGLAYWPGTEAEFWASFATTPSAESGRYDTVIHLRTPASSEGYNQANPVRTESAADAADIDERLLHAWKDHPRRFVVPSSIDFMDKAATALQILKGELPDCCAGHLPRAHPPDRG